MYKNLKEIHDFRGPGGVLGGSWGGSEGAKSGPKDVDATGEAPKTVEEVTKTPPEGSEALHDTPQDGL